MECINKVNHVLLTISLCIMVTTMVAQTNSREKIIATLNSAYIPAYSVDNLFKKPISQKGLDTWHEALKGVKTYIDEHSFGSQVLKKATTSLINLSNNIENSIKLAYNTKAVDKKTQAQRNQLAKILETLQKNTNKARAAVAAAKKEFFFLHRSSRTDAVQLITTLWNILETISQKTQKDAFVYKP